MRIGDVIGLLTSAYVEWQGLLVNPRFIRRGHTVTWNGHSSARLLIPESHGDLIQLYEDGQFTFQTSDGSLLQIYYAFSHTSEELSEARLAFYKISGGNSEFDEESDPAQIEPLSQPNSPNAGGTRPTVTWLRIDYSPRLAAGVLHNSCHLHVSTLPSARIPVAGVPTPNQFIEFVIGLAYPDVYRAVRLDNAGNYREPGRLTTINSNCPPFREEQIFKQFTHLRIPGVARRTRQRAR